VACEGTHAQHPAFSQGHPVGQCGAFTASGIAIDSYKGRFNMLPDKMTSLVAARQELAATEVSTPRRMVRVRGKALHYGGAIPFIAVAAPSLSHLCIWHDIRKPFFGHPKKNITIQTVKKKIAL
jgi:hypothetical protein